MNEKFDREKSRVNIGEIWQNETTEGKIARLNSTKLKLQGAPMNPTVKDKIISELDGSLSNLEEQSTSEKSTHHR